MAQDASIGVTNDVLAHVNDSLTAIKEGNFKAKFETEDEKMLELIHAGKNQLLDLTCAALQATLRKKGGQIASYANLGQEQGMLLTRAAFAVMVKFSS